jgi:hypothetical protein
LHKSPHKNEQQKNGEKYTAGYIQNSPEKHICVKVAITVFQTAWVLTGFVKICEMRRSNGQSAMGKWQLAMGKKTFTRMAKEILPVACCLLPFAHWSTLACLLHMQDLYVETKDCPGCTWRRRHHSEK